jgi:hypothetical protein
MHDRIRKEFRGEVLLREKRCGCGYGIGERERGGEGKKEVGICICCMDFRVEEAGENVKYEHVGVQSGCVSGLVDQDDV